MLEGPPRPGGPSSFLRAPIGGRPWSAWYSSSPDGEEPTKQRQFSQGGALARRKSAVFQPQMPGRSNIRSILLAMMKSFSCNPLIFLVRSEIVA